MAQKNNKIIVGDISGSIRLDKYLSNNNVFSTRSQAQKAISQELITINGKPAKSSSEVKTLDVIEIATINTPEKTKNILPLNIIFEDEAIIVLNKPAGLLVHATNGSDQITLVDSLRSHTKNLSTGYSEERPGIVHRLDRDTSGLLVVAKTDEAQQKLYEQFKDKTIQRTYLAITFGSPKNTQGTISSFIIRNPTQRTKRLSLRDPKSKQILRPENNYQSRDIAKAANARIAVTHYKKISTGKDGISLLELNLETGRTHQIRVHLSESGFPILGDRLYTAKSFTQNLKNIPLRNYLMNLHRCALHAKHLKFIHPKTNQEVIFAADLPNELNAILSLADIK